MSWALTLVGNVLLFALVFGMSATVDIRCMKRQIGNKNAILLGLFCQFILLPFLGFLAVEIMNLDAATGMTLLVVTASPGGSYSNWWCSLFNADLALSVTMTAISTILSTIALPANLLLYANIAYEADITQQLDWKAVFISLAIVISAIAVGLYCSYYTHSYKFNIIANKIGNFSGLALVLFSATVTNTGDEDVDKIWERDWNFYIACIFPCLVGLLVACFLASVLKLEKPERITVAVECCYQNVGIATSLALTMFRGDELSQAMGVPFFYGMVEAVIVGGYCVICWKCGWSKAPADAPIWEVVFRTYEVFEAEQNEIEYEEEIEVEMPPTGSEHNEDTHEGNVYHHMFQFMEEQPNRRKSGRASLLRPRMGRKEPSGWIASPPPADISQPLDKMEPLHETT